MLKTGIIILKKQLSFLLFSLLVLLSKAESQSANITPPHSQLIDNQSVVSKFVNSVSGKVSSISEKLNKKSERVLAKFKKQEQKLLHQLNKIDSSSINKSIDYSTAQYQVLEAKLKNPAKLTEYIAGFDSLNTSLHFLNSNSNIIDLKNKLENTLGKMDLLQTQLQKAEMIKQFLKERKQFLKEQLEKFGLVKNLKNLNKEVYYYQQQIVSYKDLLNDPKKIEKKVLGLLSKTTLWKDFFRKNSLLASMFRIPDTFGDPAILTSLSGLQTRAQVNGIIQTQLAMAGPSAMQQFQSNIQNAQAQLNQLKEKVLRQGGSSSDAAMPEGFKPNNQKTKSFLQRLEYGTNIQSQKATNYFPVTSDLGISVGYKMNDKSILGIGVSYKLGWGTGWDNIKLSSEGVGLRSYIDWKIKGGLWISGGYEQNYRTAFENFAQLRNRNAWQQSGVLGVSKKFSFKSKLLKQTNIRLLWDFLSYQQVPRTQAVVFRIGYNLK